MVRFILTGTVYSVRKLFSTNHATEPSAPTESCELLPPPTEPPTETDPEYCDITSCEFIEMCIQHGDVLYLILLQPKTREN